MDDSQPRQQQNAQNQATQNQAGKQQQPQQQQQRSRSRLTADGQTSRRPRAVAGQRAAAKRAAEPVQRTRAVQVIEPARDDSSDTAADIGTPADGDTRSDIDAAVDTALDTTFDSTVEPELAESREPAESPETTESRTKRTARTHTARTTRTARRAIVTAVLALALVAAVTVGAIFAVQYRDAIRTDHARTAAMAAAKRAAPVIFSYDYRHLDQDFGKAEAYLTGAFRAQYAKTTQTVVKPTALQYHGIVQANVAKPTDGSAAAVSVVSAAPDQVVVLAFIDQSTTSTRVTGTQVDQNRVLLTLTHTSQGWLISAVDAL